MQLIVGLGNPGREYEATRHNAGFLALDRLAERQGFDRPTHFKSSQISKGSIEGIKVVLAWPQTYMNLSGQAVQELASFYKIPGHDILVMHDEMDLPPGRLKLDLGGGAAGHNGLTSIMRHLPDEFCRLRIGIGRPPKEFFTNGSADYVLGRFLDLEWPEVDKSFDEAAVAAVDWLTLGLTKTQIKINRRKKAPKSKPPQEDGTETIDAKEPSQ
ncbi:aminoacyl-tRNA hydrolase [Deltaproteobacteria bacterium Smac51]|nr:aminoacyl-tRNA hydrolase [Deltaproteobacteria bacterium Smac51]